MGQIMFNRSPTGKIGLGLFVVAISAFLTSALDPDLGPFAVALIVAGVAAAILLSRRHSQTPHIDPRQADESGERRPIEPH
jgi:hypothetical protein